MPPDTAVSGAAVSGAAVGRAAVGRDDLFRLLADPTRRRILDLLAENGELHVGELAAAFPDLVASGISKHLMALRAAGLVHATKDGRRQRYRLDPDALGAALAPWLAVYERYWTGALERLRDLAEGAGHDDAARDDARPATPPRLQATARRPSGPTGPTSRS